MTTLTTPPTGDARVYIATARRGIPAHQPTGDGITRCGRSTRSGQTMAAGQAIAELAVTWCVVCWTPGLGFDRTPGVPDPAGRPKPIPAHSIWRDVEVPSRRLRVHLVTPTTVTARVSYSLAADAWRTARRTVSVPRVDWHRLYRRETAEDLGVLR